MRVLRAGDGRAVALEGPLLGRGGEASVYAVPDCPDLAAKVYHNPTAEQAGKLAAMLAAPPAPPTLPSPAGGEGNKDKPSPAEGEGNKDKPSPAEGEGNKDKPSPPAGEGRVGGTATGHAALAWPVDLLLEVEGEHRIVGYLMPRVADAHLLWEFFNPGARRQVCPQFHYGSLLRTARNLACVVRTLHERGYVVGDLNESNVLVRPDALVTLIDVDSFQVTAADRVHRCPVGRPEYTPPELQGVAFAAADRRPEHDAFALAVLVFQLLMQGTHPFAGAWAGDGEPDPIPARIAAGAWPYAWERPGPVRPGPHAPPWFVLPPAVQELLRLCFEDAHEAPTLRPGAAQWQHALEEAETNLTTCARNGQHVYAHGLDVCPWCALAREQGRDPFPTAEEVRAQRREPPSQPPAPAPARTAGPAPIREDPPRSRPAPADAGGVGAGLRRLGAALDRRSWLPWLGAALVGAVAGLLWALTHPPAPAEQAHASRPSPAPPVEPPAAEPPAAPPADAAWPNPVPPPAVTAPGGGGGGKTDAPPPTMPPAPAERPPRPVTTPPPAPPAPPGASPQKAYQDAMQDYLQATNDYRQAMLDYVEAVQDHRPAAALKQEAARRFTAWQAALRKFQAAQQAVANAIQGQ